MTDVNNVDDMPNITWHYQDDVYMHDEIRYETIVLEVFTAVGLCSFISNVLIIFVILKYKKMWDDATNLIFLQVNILQAIYLFSTPLTIRVAMAFINHSPAQSTLFCVAYHIQCTLMFTVTWFLSLLLCDWYLKLHCQDTYVQFSRNYKFIVIGLDVLVIFTWALTIELCFEYGQGSTYIALLYASVGLLVICLLFMNTVRAIRKRRGNIGLAVVNICFLSSSPGLLFVLIRPLAGLGYHMNTSNFVIVLFASSLLSPFLNLIYLYFYDDNYNVFLKKVFTCKCNENNNESLDTGPVTYNDVEGVHMPEN